MKIVTVDGRRYGVTTPTRKGGAWDIRHHGDGAAAPGAPVLDRDLRRRAKEAFEAAKEADYIVIYDEFESPCEHPLCDRLHQRFMHTNEYGDRFHLKTNRQWIILRDGERVGDAWDTKREALAQAAQKPRY